MAWRCDFSALHSLAGSDVEASKRKSILEGERRISSRREACTGDYRWGQIMEGTNGMP